MIMQVLDTDKKGEREQNCEHKRKIWLTRYRSIDHQFGYLQLFSDDATEDFSIQCSSRLIHTVQLYRDRCSIQESTDAN